MIELFNDSNVEGCRQEIAEEGPRTKEMRPGTFLIWADVISS